MVDTKSLRCVIGILGMLLPIIVAVLSLVYGYGFPDSVSATYFIPTCITPFMIILGASGILLCVYRGYDIVDNILNTLAGIGAWLVCLFPCAATEADKVGTFQIDKWISDDIHMIAALGFFGILAFNSLFQFTKGEKYPTEKKKKRNIIYIVCGVGMLLSFSLIAIDKLWTIPHVIWVVETIALFFFGLSWLTKANCIKFLFAD